MAMGAGLRSTAKAVKQPPDPTASAPKIYPDNAERVKVYVALEIPGAGSQNCGLALIPLEH